MSSFDYTQLGLAAIFNIVGTKSRGLTSVEIPLIGRMDAVPGSFVQGLISNTIYQYLVPLIFVDVLLEELVYDPAAILKLRTNFLLTLGGTGAISQWTTATLLTENNTSNFVEGIQGAAVNSAALIGSYILSLPN